MALEDWQVDAYRDTVTVYRIKRGAVSGDKQVDPTPVATGLIGMFVSTENVDQPTMPIAMTKHDIMITLDRWHCESGSNIIVGDVIKLTTSGHPENGSYYVVRGEAKQKPSFGEVLSNQSSYFVNRTTKPKGIP